MTIDARCIDPKIRYRQICRFVAEMLNLFEASYECTTIVSRKEFFNHGYTSIDIEFVFAGGHNRRDSLIHFELQLLDIPSMRSDGVEPYTAVIQYIDQLKCSGIDEPHHGDVLKLPLSAVELERAEFRLRRNTPVHRILSKLCIKLSSGHVNQLIP